MKPLNKLNRALALAILLLVGILDVVLWRTSSPFVSETHVNPTAIVITGGAVTISMLVNVLQMDFFVWPTAWAAAGALLGTFRTIVTFSGTGGFQTVDGKVAYISEALQNPLPGPSYALIGIAIGLFLYLVSYKIRDVVARMSKRAYKKP